jgi:hypothetical protein
VEIRYRHKLAGIGVRLAHTDVKAPYPCQDMGRGLFALQGILGRLRHKSPDEQSPGPAYYGAYEV